MVTDPAVLVEQSGALRTGHFVLDSGLHATRYFQAVDLLAETTTAALLFDAVAHRWAGRDVHVVLGANEAGSVMAWSIAERLGAEPRFARRSAGGYEQFGGQALLDARVLVVDDITTTGSTARALLDVVERGGAASVGVALLASKGLSSIDLGVETSVLVTLDGMDAFAATSCPECAQNAGPR